MYRLVIILSFIILFSLTCFSQNNGKKDFCNEINNNKVLKNYEKAIELLISKKYDEAESILLQVVSSEPNFAEAWMAYAEILHIKYENSYNSKAADSYFSKYAIVLEKIIEICPDFQNYKLQYILGKIYYSKKEFEKTSKYLNIYISNVNDESDVLYIDSKTTLDYVDEYLDILNNPVMYNPNVVEGLSSVDDEYLPLISPDGSLALFTHAYMKKDMSSSYLTKYTEEFTVAYPVDDSGIRFTGVEAMSYPFNTGRNQGAATITIDNSILFMTICEFVSRDYNNCDIYYSIKKSSGWTELKNMGPNINGLYTWESQPSISADGKILYFASIRPGNIGFDPNNPTSDIYMSVRQDDGTWSKAKNLGSVINTPFNEKSPFIHSDSQTLYFSSDGHVTVGGYDIYFSKFRENEWAKPKNIGYPINTINDDIGFVVNTQGTKAYFASNKLKGKGGWDIYSIELYQEARPEKVFLVKGQLIDDVGHSITDAKLEVKNVNTDEIIEGLVDSETGNYAVAVSTKKEESDYLMIVKKEGYSFTSALIETNEAIYDSLQVVDFEVKPIEEGKAVELNDIYFATASYQIDIKSNVVLNSFIEFLNDNSSIKIEIRGHTDNVGSLQTNVTLSNQRAKAVYDYLITNGIEPIRLKYKGYGPNMPISSNDTEEGKAKNRRTEFFIIAK